MFKSNDLLMKKIFIIFVLFALMLTSTFAPIGITSVEAAGNTYYVDAVNGDDTTGTGSSGSPWKTISKAAGIIMAGDTCIIRSGTYRETVNPVNSGTSTAPITFKADTGATVTVSGLDPVSATWTNEPSLGTDVYKANISMDLGPGNQVFYDNNLMMEARWPNSGNTNPADNTFLLEPSLAVCDTGTTTVNDNLKFFKNYLIGSWEFENNCNDSSSSQHTALNYNGSYVTGSHDGSYAMSLNGTNAYVYIPERPTYAFKPSNVFTISAWIKTSSVNAPIISKGRFSSDSNLEYRLYLDSNGKIAFERYYKSTGVTYSLVDTNGIALNDNNWHQVAFVQESAASHKLYVDGALVESTTASWSNDCTQREPIYIGRYKNYTISDTYFNGLIDDVKIYNSALAGSDIYNNSSNFIKGIWKFENNAEDSSSFLNNGTVYNTVYVEDSPDSEYSLKFNGTNSYVSIPHNDSLTFGAPDKPFTVTAWIKTNQDGSVLAKGRDSLSNIDYRMFINNGKLGFERWKEGSGATSIIDSDGNSINNDRWHHIAFINENASSHKLYIDGYLVETNTAAWVDDCSNTETLYIGRYKNYTYSDYYFNGLIDSVNIYGKALKDSEILDYADIYDTGFPAGIDLTGAQVHHFSYPNHGWETFTSYVLKHSGNTLRIGYRGNGLLSQNYTKAGSVYYLFGKKELLDAEREWFYEPSSSTLYFYKPGGGVPQSNNMEIKKRTNGFDISGKSYINIEKINLFGCTIKSGDTTASCTIDGITAKYIYHNNRCANNFWSQMYDTGIILRGNSNGIKNSEIGYSSGNGISISGGSNNVINCYIHNTDYIGSYAAGVALNTLSKSLISHNTISRTGRHLISGDGAANLIQYNDLSYLGYLSGDTGAVYMTTTAENTRIHHNVIHDVRGSNRGIYLDNNTGGYIIDHNVVRNNSVDSVYSIHLNITDEYSLIYNNSSDKKIGCYYASAEGVGYKFPTDVLGMMIYNNITIQTMDNNNIYGVNLGELVKPSKYNLENADVYTSTSDYHLKPLPGSSSAVDKGFVIPGITQEYDGLSPDFGAYEYGADWSAGHNFSNPPDPKYKEPDIAYMNRINNDSFKRGMDNWTVTPGSTDVDIPDCGAVYWASSFASSKSGSQSVRLGSGTNGVSQTITGLLPDKVYRATAWAKVTYGETAEFKVDGFGGTQVSATQGYTENTWKRLDLTFKTGKSSTGATVYLSKTSTGADNVYFDDTGLQALMVYEDFEDNSANNWNVSYGTWSIETDGSKVYKSSGTQGMSINNVVWSDLEIEADIKPLSFSGGSVAINFRYTDNNNRYTASLMDNTVRINKIVNGTYTTIASKAYTINTNTTYNVKVTAISGVLKLYINEVEELSVNDNSHSSGKVALECYNSTAEFDKVLISQPYSVFEDFEDNSADNWSVYYGTWTIEADGTKVYKSSGTQGMSIYNFTWSDLEASIDVKPLTFTSEGVAVINFRYTDSNNRYTASLNNGAIRLNKWVNGVYTQMVTKTYTINTGQTYNVKVVAISDALKLYINGTEELTVNDNSLSSGKVTLECYNATAEFDNIKIQN